jgi:hypothetical protein
MRTDELQYERELLSRLFYAGKLEKARSRFCGGRLHLLDAGSGS